MEIYQRFRFLSTEERGFGLYFDLGIYGNWAFINDYIVAWNSNLTNRNSNYGLRTRFGYEMLAIYGQYQISDTFTNNNNLSKLIIGIELSIPLGSNRFYNIFTK